MQQDKAKLRGSRGWHPLWQENIKEFNNIPPCGIHRIIARITSGGMVMIPFITMA